MTDTPQISDDHLQAIAEDRLFGEGRLAYAPRILLLYGSLRERSFSRLMTEEAARVLHRLGAETRTFNPSGLPLPDDAEADHPKVQQLREAVTWSEGMVWCSPERHGAMTGNEISNRLDSLVYRGGAPNLRQDAGGDASLRGLSEF